MIKNIFNSIVKNDKIFLMICIALMSIFAVLSTNFSKSFHGDAFYYLLKAFEMKFGNWEVFKSDPIGNPIISFVFLKILNINSLFQAIILSRILTIIFTVISIFPLWLISKKLFTSPFHFLPTLFYVFSSKIILQAGEGMTEPAFIFFTLMSMLFLFSESNLKNLLFASFFAALSYYMRFNGSFMLATILLYQFYLVIKKQSKWYYSILILAVFLVTVLPDFYLRYITHGTIFDYGANSKYFIDNYNKVWFNDTQSPSLLGFLTQSSFFTIFKKFILNGFFKVNAFLFLASGAILYFLFLYGIFKIIKTKKLIQYLPIALFVALNIAGLSMVFEIFYAERHLYVLLPIVFLISTFSISILYNFSKTFKYITFSILIAFFVVNFAITTKQIKPSNFDKIKLKEWAVWASENTSGKVYMFGGDDFIRTVFLNKDIRTSKHQVEFAKHWNYYFAPQKFCENMNDFYAQFAKKDREYLILFKHDYEFYPFLKSIHSEKWKQKFYVLKSFPDDELKVEIFVIQ